MYFIQLHNGRTWRNMHPAPTSYRIAELKLIQLRDLYLPSLQWRIVPADFGTETVKPLYFDAAYA